MAITVPQLTVSPSGDGIFDVLMRSMKAHLEQEYTKGRIKGTEYSQVYLGALESVLQASMSFLLTRDKAAQEALLIAAQVALVEQQKANAIIEGQNLVLQGELLSAQKLNLDVERALTVAKTDQTEEQTLQIIQATANSVIEGTVLVAQECKLRAEYDNLMAQKLRTEAENSLLGQKLVTEKAQTTAGVTASDSVLGKQKALYDAQAAGFVRDSEQKVAQIMVDTWKIRRTTNETTEANAINKLSDDVVGRAVNKLLTGVGA